MKKIILFIFLVLFASAFFVNHLRADVTLPDVPVTLNAIFDDENGLINSPIGAQVYGSTITVHQSIGQPGSDFAFWVVNGVIRQDLPIDHSFVVTSTLNLLAVFHPTDPLEYAVVFMDANGALIGDPQYVTPGDNAVEPVELPNKPGLAIAQTKWRTPLGAEAILTNIQSNSVFILQYESASVDTFTITVENAAGSGTYNYNQLVSLTADLTSGSDDFSHWAEGDVVLSYDPNYVFTVVGDRTITAVYKAITDDIVPVVTMTKDLEVRGGYHTYLGQYYLPPTFTVVEYGFLIHEDNTLDLTLTTPGVQIAMNNKAHPLTNEFVMSFPYGSLFNVQGYLVVSNGVDLITVYTNQNSRYIADPLYAEDFESVTTWGSYPTTDALRTFGGIEWTVKEVIMNPDSSDLNSSILATHGTKMLRFRGANNAYIFNNDFLDYIYSFDFDAKYYNASHTTAVMKVWYQINGDDWQEIETISLTDSYANFSVIVDKSNVRVRITVDSRSANVDNLVINGIYSGPSNLVTFNNDDVLADVLVK
ncbi:MAG: InlB B-repeat-containing protein, partial [Acholeplasmataceae bacterium]